jgi:dephospho-CoA kinase
MGPEGEKKLVVGLIGGIGSGKSAVAEALARRGGRIISGDAHGHAVLRRPEVREAVARIWGPELLDADGQVRRRELGKIVFADPGERRKLEDLVHPRIREGILEELARAQKDPRARFLVLDAAVMLEAGWADVCNKLVFVDASADVRYERLARQRGWTADEVRAREEAQMPLTEKAARADHVLDNSADPEHLNRQIDELLDRWGLLAPAPALPR